MASIAARFVPDHPADRDLGRCVTNGTTVGSVVLFTAGVIQTVSSESLVNSSSIGDADGIR
ncbi:hypothetical protein SAMN06265222_105137 [Neorhodopirellula lusitana]|uniref:Uncharacterized protein n=1 Tax=Neorhodopirellula lusitana TaxID=445327 RepID=A0ABY1Q2P6_9BACT|nr:hypothetical protein [Neorhodopirellula lusitana]SMP56351.1 hypothetical protein SAMN06265222_105137 [Neorhodopirellula lusitana]